MDFLISTSSQGLLWSILAIGVYLSFRILDIPDMTVEGAYPLGAAVTATFIVNGWSPLLATIAGFLAGVMTGFVTGFLQTAMHIPGLLAGILTMTALYSINLRVMGKSNQVLLDQETLLTQLEALGIPHNVRTLVLGLIAMIIVIMLLVAFMYTELGLNFRATGDNPEMAAANGIHVDRMKCLGLMLSSGLVSLSGAMLGQANGFADVGRGTGTIVIGLAAVFIAEVLFRNLTFGQRLLTVVLGAIIYRIAIDLVMHQELLPIRAGDIKLLSAILLAIIVWLSHLTTRRKQKKVA